MHADDQGLSVAHRRPRDLETVAPTVDHAERSDPASTYPARARRGPQPHRNCPPVAHQPGHRAPVAPPLPRRRARRLGRSPAVGAADGHRPAHRRAHPVSDHRAGARRGDPLEHAADGALRRASRSGRCGRSGGRPTSSRIGSRPSSSAGTRSLPRRSSTWSGSTSTRPTTRWCSRSTRRRRSRRSTARSRACR